RRVVGHEIELALHFLVERAHGERARHLAGGVAPHAVADDEEPELLVDEKVVLVVITLAAYVRQRGELGFRANHAISENSEPRSARKAAECGAVHVRSQCIFEGVACGPPTRGEEKFGSFAVSHFGAGGRPSCASSAGFGVLAPRLPQRDPRRPRWSRRDATTTP